MKFLKGQYYVEVNDKGYIIHPTDHITQTRLSTISQNTISSAK